VTRTPAGIADVINVVEAPELPQVAATSILRAANEAIAARGAFTIALSGGSTPPPAFRALAERRSETDWARWHVFWGDERCVPPDSDQSNFGMAREALLSRVSVPGSQVHRMRGELPPDEAARLYIEELERHFGAGVPALDVVLQGVGEDGHTASLFPGTEPAEEDPLQQPLVVPNVNPHDQSRRLTLTFRVLNAARQAVFLVSGDSKAEVLRRVLVEGESSGLPAARLRPASPVVWLIDRQAAARLPQNLVDGQRSR
jgi:6-phosphogluconolactonase